ncbi:MAG: hypothetical protein ACRDHX_06795, partial [Chloroflexota bacterium]
MRGSRGKSWLKASVLGALVMLADVGSAFGAGAAPAGLACGVGWYCGDVGQPAWPAQLTLSDTTWTVHSWTGDVWGTADQFSYAAQPVTGDATLSALATIGYARDPWVKAGVMLRQANDPGAPYYGVFVSAGNGLVVQVRPSQGAFFRVQARVDFPGPAYVAVSRSGNDFAAYYSEDGSTYTKVPGSEASLSLGSTYQAELSVSAHQSGLATATFDHVALGTSAPALLSNVAPVLPALPLQPGTPSLAGHWLGVGSIGNSPPKLDAFFRLTGLHPTVSQWGIYWPNPLPSA